MKALIAYFRLTLLVTLISASPTYAEILESEPNNDFTTSDKVENGSSFSGQLYGQEDTDFYSFDVKSPSSVDLKISLPTNSASDYFSVRILDLKEAVYVGYTSGRPEGILSTFISEPGTYYIVVEPAPFSYDSRRYAVTLNVTPIETSNADPTSSEEINTNLEEKVVELEQKIDVLLKTITALNSLEDESTRAKNIEKLLDQVKGGSADEKQQLLQLEAENTELKNNIGHIARQVLELGNQLDKFSQAPMLKEDASSTIDEQTERLESIEEARKEADQEVQRLQIALAASLVRQDELVRQLEAVNNMLNESNTRERAQFTQLSDLQSDLARALLDLENQRDATDAANLQRDRAEERIAELENAFERLAGQNEGALKSLEQQLAEALATKVKAEGERQNLTEDLQAALAARLAADALADERLSALEQREILLAEARKSLGVSKDLSEKRANELIEAAKQQELLNQQVATLRAELGKLQELLALSEQKDADAQIQLQNLGNRLNAALARAASEERKRRKLEEAERIRLEAEAKKLKQERNQLADQAQDLANYKSEFFGRLREILAGQEGVKIVGDRFVFSSEVLFEPGAASLSEAGQLEIDKVANILLGVKDSIPDTIEWVIRVDGHTDNIPLSGAGEFRDNWELSQARALSVVRYMVEALQFPANRMSANGFGEFQPVNTDDTPEARAQNRRIEINLRNGDCRFQF